MTSQPHQLLGRVAALGDQVVTGPTLTNVNDFRANIFYDRNNTSTLTMTGQSENAFAGAVYAKSGTLSLTGTSGASTTMESPLVPAGSF